MRKIGDKANGCVIQRLHSLRSSALLTGTTRISNRKSGIRIRPKSREISTLQIPNRKYFAIFDRRSPGSSRFLIHGSAIKTPRNTSKKNTYEFLIGGKPRVKGCPVARPKPPVATTTPSSSWVLSPVTRHSSLATCDCLQVFCWAYAGLGICARAPRCD